MKTGQSTLSLSEIIKKYDKLRVEDYQRTYSWKDNQIQDLFEDLKATASDDDAYHFFGTLILQVGTEDGRLATVVDGQQRLTTVFLFLAALRDAVRELSIQEIAPEKNRLAPIRPLEIAWSLILTDKLAKGNFRFESSRFLRKIMTSCVLAEPEDQEELPLRDKKVTLAFRKGVRYVRSLVGVHLKKFPSDEEKLVAAHNLIKALIERFYVLQIETGSLGESLDIFLTLNDRGEPLGPSDLVRGDIMRILGEPLEEKEQAKLHADILDDWTAIVEKVAEPEIFLRHYLLSTGSEKVQKKKVVDITKFRLVGKDSENLDDSQRLKRTQEFWKDLKKAASRYGSIIEPTTFGDEANYHLRLLEGLQKSHRIVLLTLIEKAFEGEEQAEIIRLLYVLSFRWAMADKSRQAIEDLFQKVSQEMRENSTAQQVIDYLREECDAIDLDFAKFFKRDVDGDFVLRGALHYVNKVLAKGTILHDVKTLHVEHIAPQSETDEWLDAIYGADKNRYGGYESLVSSGGNLTLLDPGLNVKIGNKSFNDKKAEYTKSGMFITSNLCEFDSWDETLIVERSEWLADCFRELCSPSKPSKKIETFSNWYKNRK